MGFCHETESAIFGIEERTESVYLRNDSENLDQMFFNHERADSVQQRIRHQVRFVRLLRG